jgi:hypothetical protein
MSIKRGLGRLWTWLGANAESLKLIFAIIAGGYVLFQYQSNLTDESIRRTLEFQSRYGKDDVGKARIELKNFWLLDPDRKKRIEEDAEKSKAQPGAKIAEAVLKEKALAQYVWILADFFEQVTTCTQRGLCHRKTACAAFRSEVIAVRNTYFDLFKLWETAWGEDFIEKSYSFFDNKCK